MKSIIVLVIWIIMCLAFVIFGIPKIVEYLIKDDLLVNDFCYQNYGYSGGSYANLGDNHYSIRCQGCNTTTCPIIRVIKHDNCTSYDDWFRPTSGCMIKELSK